MKKKPRKKRTGRDRRAHAGRAAPARTVEDSHREFIRTNWLKLAADSWRQAQAGHRGAHAVFMGEALYDPEKTSVIINYLAEGNPLLIRRGGWPHAAAARAVAEYDPRRQVIFWFSWPEQQYAFYVVPSDGAVSPVQALEIWQANQALDNEEAHSRVLASRWLAIAARAWEKFQKDGRGLVVIDTDNTDLADPSRYCRFFYLPAGQDPARTFQRVFPFAEADDAFLNHLAELVRTYDPAKDIVALFAGATSQTLYTFAATPTPPQAHQILHSVGQSNPADN